MWSWQGSRKLFLQCGAGQGSGTRGTSVRTKAGWAKKAAGVGSGATNVTETFSKVTSLKKESSICSHLGLTQRLHTHRAYMLYCGASCRMKRCFPAFCVHA